MSEEFEISDIVKKKNDEINRKFIMSIDGNTDLLDKSEEIQEEEALKPLNENVKNFLNSLNKEGFFKSDTMHKQFEAKILYLLNNQNSAINKIAKSVEFNFFFDLAKPYLLEIMKNWKEKGANLNETQ